MSGLGFRARLTVLIAGLFILASGMLLLVQYVLVQELLASETAKITYGCAEVGPLPPSSPLKHLLTCGDRPGDVMILFEGSEAAFAEVMTERAQHLSQEVLSSLILWSVILLLVFAALSVLAARWLSRRSLSRIAHITATTREITQEDLSRRLDVSGPDDEIKELGDTIDGMLDRLDDAFIHQERFAAAASHELRTPLTVTRTALEIPLELGRFDAAVEPAVRRALAANQRSEQLISALLTLARMTGAPVTVHGVSDLKKLVRQSLADRADEVSSRRLRVTMTGEATHALADPTLAAMLVGNLLDNAIRHNVIGGELTVFFGTSDARSEIMLSNDGRKLTEDEVARLTEPFHRGDRTRLTGPGTGLGLTLAESIVKRLKGSLRLAPRPSGGLVVRLTLPRCEPAGAEVMTATSAPAR